MKVAVLHEPINIPITDPQTLLAHPTILLLRRQRIQKEEQELDKLQIELDRADYHHKKAQLAYDQCKLELDQLDNQTKHAINDFFAQARASTPLMKTLLERYGRGVQFIFDSDATDVRVVGLSSNDAPPLLKDDEDAFGEPFEMPGEPVDDDDAGPGGAECSYPSCRRIELDIIF